MLESYQICPYTGLRSFTEEESLYFKGREDDIDQATSQLQKNKFLMLTGASGDGKSSLIYAGIIPNARAGFLKSKYSQWCVADFRPMRSPFHNLCRSIARQLEIADHRMVESELQHGFSALVDLYKNSKRYADPDSVAWQQADEKGRAALKREAANLIILVDQFEEFFTNAENYHNGVPSKESNLVLNLLLETARIALDENLPIYIVFTMRSDYIGQCAAFRGLPEYLGFSQFFVPRLNRVQLQQVIEEPAVLSGNRISRRLTERLIHDITEGVDQLPILQHALNQIWVAADRGNEEMDLIHYAMVGGMPVDELPDEQVEHFNKWFSTLPPEIQACYHEPNLQNVLDTHTNKLYQQASRYYLEKTGKTISNADAQMITKTAFTCLTKIDQGRAVRNRMTLLEITNILGKPTFDTETVGAVLNIFREPGNTFIHPFIHEDDPDSAMLHGDDVLDITHESLIRNWDYLKQWAEEENNSRSISLDFEQQLGRWVNSKKSNAFLLSIGPLTYFENWFKKTAPNAYWIARYLPDESDKEIKLEKANEVLGNANEFLDRSASKHVITRTIMRYGPRRIAAALGILALITLSAFGVNSYFSKQNNSVLKDIRQQTLTLAADPKANFENKMLMLGEALRSKLTSVDEIISGVKDPIEKLRISNGLAALLIYQGRDEPAFEIARSLTISDSLLQSFDPSKDISKSSPILKGINNFRVVLALGYQYNSSKEMTLLVKRNADRSAKWVRSIADQQPASFTDIENFNLALENAINYQALGEADITKLLNILSPIESGEKSKWVQTNYHADKLMLIGVQGYGMKHNGLYQELAYLYAAIGNSSKALQCLDTLLKYSQSNFEGKYANGTDNAYHIASVYYTYKKTAALDDFVAGYCARTQTTIEQFYASLIGRCLPGYITGNLDLFGFMNGKQNLALVSMGQEQLSWFFEKYRTAVRASTANPDALHFQIASSYKNQGLLSAVRHEFPGRDSATINALFAKALDEYQQISTTYLESETKVMGVSSTEELIVPRKFSFIYPGLKFEFHPIEPRSYNFDYVGDSFLAYILDQGLFGTFYPSARELNYITNWLSVYSAVEVIIPSWELERPRYDVLQRLEKEIGKRNDIASTDMNWLYLYLGRMANTAGNRKDALKYYEKIQFDKIFNLLVLRANNNYGNLIRDEAFRLLAEALQAFAGNNRTDLARKLIGMFKNPVNRSSLYAYAGSELLKEKASVKIGTQLLDSAKAEMARVENTTLGQQNRINIAYGLTLESPKDNASQAYRLIKNLNEKFVAIAHITRSFAYHGDLYGARVNIPENISGTDRANFLNLILMGYNEGAGISGSEWSKYMSYSPGFIYSYIKFIDENS